jgi:hypothetical protein
MCGIRLISILVLEDNAFSLYLNMKTALTAQEFSKLIIQDDFVLKTQRQIIKDFGTVGQDFDAGFSEHSCTAEQIIQEIQPRLIDLMRTGEQTLLRFLYQVDIPEQGFLMLIGNSNMAAELSELILQREAYKVYLRSQF